ncbi:MAG: methylated-DNA--[protein]-cysteine S-methyltransferase [Proteobacteria bacterium]|nr:methylated-DNA--[protein]-cysteine S-methyltransferase [Pseudomonadota bacterium]
MERPEHLTRTLDSPVGRLALTAVGPALVRISWADQEPGDPLAVAGDSPVLTQVAAQIEQYFAGARRVFDLPSAPAGTGFQRRVWTEMTRIPFGSTSTYGALADKLGSSPRAVGQACGANPIPIVIPCHRVLGAGGNPGGYSGGAGLDTKLALLALEGARPSEPDLFGRNQRSPRPAAPRI